MPTDAEPATSGQTTQAWVAEERDRIISERAERAREILGRTQAPRTSRSDERLEIQ